MVEREAQSLSFPPESPIGVERGDAESRRAWRRGSLHTGKQHVNARKPPVRVWQVSNSEAAGGGVISFRLIDREIFVFQIDGADREDDPQRNCCPNDEYQSDRFVGHRGCSL